jgi:hypothetical protein
MVDPKPPSLFETAVAELRAGGVQLDTPPGEYRVNYRGGKPETAYFTDDLADAIEHGRAMAAARAADQAAPTTPESTQRAPRRKWHKKMTPKAQRRRLIRQHNRRLRARAIIVQKPGGRDEPS